MNKRDRQNVETKLMRKSVCYVHKKSMTTGIEACTQSSSCSQPFTIQRERRRYVWHEKSPNAIRGKVSWRQKREAQIDPTTGFIEITHTYAQNKWDRWGILFSWNMLSILATLFFACFIRLTEKSQSNDANQCFEEGNINISIRPRKGENQTGKEKLKFF